MSVKEKTEEISWVSSEIVPEVFVTVDKYQRIYFNKQAMELIGITERNREIFIGYDFANKRMIVANPNVVRPTNVIPHRVDKRGYTSARPFLRQLSLSESDLPLRYKYIGKDYTVKGAFAFAMYGDKGADGGL
mgnify:CR=1 FL=1